MNKKYEEFIWCCSCDHLLYTKPITNNGGDCCLYKCKRGYGEKCKHWIKMSPKREHMFSEYMKFVYEMNMEMNKKKNKKNKRK